MTDSTLIVHNRQADFLEDLASRKLLLHGGRGCGKSVALCLKLVGRACRPGAREGLGRKHLKHLKATTLKTLLEGDGSQPAILPANTYTHNKSEGVIKIHRGGEIVYFGLDDDPLKAGSFNFSGLALDEMIEFTERDYMMLRGCVRVKVPGIENQIYAACNPSVPSHWVAKEFGLALDHKPQPGCRAIFTSPYDNFALPKDFIKDLENMPGIAKKRFLLGQWVGSDGLVYDLWDRSIHVRERPEPAGGWRAVYVGLDEGYTCPFVVLRCCVDEDERIHVEREFYQPRQLKDHKIAATRRLSVGATKILADPSAAGLIADLRADGLDVGQADNSLEDGILRVQSRLAVQADGLPRLTVDPSCSRFICDMETYEWEVVRQSQALKDVPKKKDDHGPDAVRYVVNHVDRGIRPFISVTVPDATPVARGGIGEWMDRPPVERPFGDPGRGWKRRGGY